MPSVFVSWSMVPQVRPPEYTAIKEDPVIHNEPKTIFRKIAKRFCQCRDRSGSRRRALNVKFVGSGLLLFLDYLFVAIGGWLFWIVISKVASISDIGTATTIYSLVVTVATITQLGAEYPLLKKSHVDRSVILGTGLVIQLAISMVAIPIMILVISKMYEGSLQEFAWIAVVLVILIAIEFVVRYVLLGVFDAKKVQAIDMLGLSVKFLVGGHTCFNSIWSLWYSFCLLIRSASHNIHCGPVYCQENICFRDRQNSIFQGNTKRFSCQCPIKVVKYDYCKPQRSSLSINRCESR